MHAPKWPASSMLARRSSFGRSATAPTEKCWGEKRADDGAKIVVTVSRELAAEFGSGFEEKNLHRMVQFAKVLTDREIVATTIELVPLHRTDPPQ